MYKPTFGATSSTGGFGSFSGAANAIPFGQTSVFGKTPTTGFGQNTFGTAGTSNLFGSTLSSTNNLFGSSTTAPAFGQAQTTQPSFGFGATGQQTTNLFGAQPTTGTGLFGATTNSAFGQNKPTFGSTFGAASTTGLFGAQQPTQPAAPLFGAAPNATAFGASTSAFGTTAQQSGTVIKFNPITGTDTLQKGTTSQQINTRHFCITCMKEYENKSLEELRLEDYVANRKGPQQQSGLFGQTQQPSLFGATSTGLFGSQPAENKPLFGSTATSLGGFGTSGGGVFGQQPASSSSLFSKPANFGTTTQTSTGFGFGSTNNSLFNTAQKPFGAAPTTSLFGQTATQPAAGFGTTSGFSGFGTQPNQSIGLFGQQNLSTSSFSLGTTTPSTGFSFGQTSTAGTSLFPTKPATTGFGTTPGFGTAGTTFGAPTTGANLFNKTPSLSFNFPGTMGGAGGGLNLNPNNSSLFGNTQQKPGGLFGNTTTSTTGLFGSTGFGTTGTSFGTGTTGLGGSTLGGTTSLFGSSTLAPSVPSAAPAHSAILALASLPFADSPLFKNLLPAAGKSETSLKPGNAVAQKAILASKDLKVSPKADTKIKLKPFVSSQTKKSLFEGLDEPLSLSPEISSSNVKKLTLKPRALHQSLNDSLSEAVANKENRRVSFLLPVDTPRSGSGDRESFYIRRNPLFQPQNQPPPQTSMDELEPAASSTIVESSDVIKSPGRLSDEKEESCQISLDKSTDKNASSQSSGILDSNNSFLNKSSKLNEDWSPHPTGIILRRLDYYTIPSLEELEGLVADDGSCIVENFCIGRHGYGNIYFDDTMDVSGLDIDSFVHFRHNEVNVYPDESMKPPVGEGLNRKCQVTLEQVWPLDKVTREPITDLQQLQDMEYEDKLRRCTNKMRAHFVEYRPATGSWVFRVDHFSKYGLSDSEDDDELVPVGGVKPKPKPIPKVPPQAPPVAVPTQISSLKTPANVALSPVIPHKQQCFAVVDAHTGEVTFNFPDHIKAKPIGSHDVSVDVDMDECVDDDNIDDALLDESPWSPSGGRIDSHRVQLMKSSLFHSQIPDDELEELTRLKEMSILNVSKSLQASANLSKGNIDLTYKLSQLQKSDDALTMDMFVPSFKSPLQPTLPPLKPRPKTVSIRRPDAVIPYSKATAGKTGTKFMADSALMMGRSFKVKWGPGSRLTCLNTRKLTQRLDVNLPSRADYDSSKTIVEGLALYPEISVYFKDSIEKHLKIQLSHSLRGDEGGCPVLSPTPGVEALHRHCLLAAELSHQPETFYTYSQQVWQLCAALWGNLPTLSPQDEPTSHRAMMMRKEALTEWLRSCAEHLVHEEAGDRSDLKAVFAHLSGHAVSKACEISQSKGEHYTALLMCSGQSGKALLQEQLREWTDVSAEAFIERERLRVYTVTSGLPVLQTSQDLLNACNGLDWRRVFGLHYWYLSSPVASITEVLAKYEEAFNGSEAYADKPHPPYGSHIETTTGQIFLDLCYHLLKLFSSRSHPLETLLNPATHTADPLDCRLSWLMEQTLSSLGYSHLSPLSSATTCVSFANQLEANGLWHWAVFVCMHLRDNFGRKKAIVELIGRHVMLLEKWEFSAEENFVVEELKIPSEWIHRAKATRALSRFLFDDATYYLIQAQEWNEAHQVFIQHIAPDLVINEKFEYLEDILGQLEAHASVISEWPQQGELLLDFLDIKRTVRQAIEERDAGQLEKRLPQLVSVSNRVVRWPTPTVKHRLCQAEIAKGAADVYVNVKQLDRSSSCYRDAKFLVSKLPLPEDYLQDLLEVINQTMSVTV